MMRDSVRETKLAGINYDDIKKAPFLIMTVDDEEFAIENTPKNIANAIFYWGMQLLMEYNGCIDNESQVCIWLPEEDANAEEENLNASCAIVCGMGPSLDLICDTNEFRTEVMKYLLPLQQEKMGDPVDQKSIYTEIEYVGAYKEAMRLGLKSIIRGENN